MNHHPVHIESTDSAGWIANASHDPLLVVFSVLIAIFAAYSALELAERVKATRGSARTIWMGAGAISLGMGIWAMHFTAMLAFTLPEPVLYHVPTVFVSLLPAVAGSLIVLRAIVDEERSIWKDAIASGCAGFGICAMHYAGMGALRSDLDQHYWVELVVISYIAAVAISFAAVRLMQLFSRAVGGFGWRKLVAAVVMGGAIPVMHYIGMAAVWFTHSDEAVNVKHAVEIQGLGVLAIILLSFVGFGFTVLSAYVDRTFATQSARLEHQASHDTLTGLPNRALMQDRMERAMRRANRHACHAAVMVIDLDGFKNVNDTGGHHVGDQLLVEIAARLKAKLRETDTVARIGGDEFVMVLEDVQSAADCALIAQQALSSIRQPVTIAGSSYMVSGSIGVSLYPNDATDTGGLLRCADVAMYAAKESGKNKFEIFSSEVNSAAQKQFQIANELMTALEKREFKLYYQPLMRRDGSIAGVEALLRWQHPLLGLVPPDRFIPLAESMGLIVPLGDWVLREACSQLRRWRELGFTELNMSVNVSALQFRRQDWIESLMRTLEEARVPANRLMIELTESVVMKDPQSAIHKLQQMSALGVSTALDDFGTGYCGLRYLQDLPIKTLKIDRSFVHRTMERGEERRSRSIVRAILEVAHILGLEVVAEGVETVGQRDFLTRSGCDTLQGYLFARPMPAQEAEAFFHKRGGTKFAPLLKVPPPVAAVEHHIFA